MNILILCMTILAVTHVDLAEKTAGKCQTGSIDRKSQASVDCNPEKYYSINCNHRSLTEVPAFYPTPESNKEPCILDLGSNNFAALKNETFVNAKNLNTSSILFLHLDNSNISYISSNAFVSLSSLLYLNLSGNHLSWPDGFGKGVFKPLTNLRHLNIKENKFESFNGLGVELGYMKNLEGIFAELCDRCKFDEEFKELPHLVNMSLSGRSENACKARVLHNKTFEGLTRLQRLWLSSCHIEEIEADTFRPLKESLVLLDISYNEKLTFSGMNSALYGLRNSSKLQTLNVNRIHNVHGVGIELKMSDIEHLSSLRTLNTLHMDLNKIEVFEAGTLYNCTFPNTLRILTLSANRLSYGKYVEYIIYAKNVTCIDVSRQHLFYDPFRHEHYEDETTVESADANAMCMAETPQAVHSYSSIFQCSFFLPPNLRRLKWRKSFLNLALDQNVTICGAKNLIYLDLSFNLIHKWKGVIKGLENLKYLDLSENYCSEVSLEFFDNFRQLEHLNISGNNLGMSFGQTTSFNQYQSNRIHVFRNLKQITNLDLSDNRIAQFSDKQIFVGLVNLHYLYLHSNLLSDWNYDMPKSGSLKVIDLSRNKLTSLPEKLRNYLDMLCQDKQCNVSVMLNYNPLECNCPTLDFLKWMRSTKVSVHRDECRFNGQHNISSMQALRKMIEMLEKNECLDKSWNTWTVGTICAVVGCLTSIVISVLAYRYRWKLRYLYYSRHRRFNHEGFERLFDNDAFVSYSKSKASFIKNCMVPSLERQRGLRLWVADRNSLPGTSVAENIVHGIYNSQKAVLLVDTDYLKDSWCDYEMNMAQTESTEANRKLIIIVLMENIPMEILPIRIMRFLRSERSLEYPENGQDLETFWTNLADEIMS